MAFWEGTNMERELIRIINPTAPRISKRTRLAPRKYRSLRHKRIGLLDNNKPNADKFLAQWVSFSSNDTKGLNSSREEK
jgi:hypothetical protein